jgi:hypothetical protein
MTLAGEQKCEGRKNFQQIHPQFKETLATILKTLQY